ncbi:M48 family metallopeptidase [Desulfovibrio sp. OttesenSCG-928-G11]|nr:M48 family metallopeptidase [Desulfovibrio sp. OttesenSCG-928-G11]
MSLTCPRSQTGPYSSAGPLRALRHDGHSAGGREVELFMPAPGRNLHICPGGGHDSLRPLAVWPLADIRVLAGRLTGKDAGPLRLGLEPDRGERLILAPGPDRDEMAAWLRPWQALAVQKRRRRWVMVCALIWALGLGLYLSGPALLDMAAAAMPRGMEESLGKEARDQILATMLYMPGVHEINETAGASPELAALMSRLEQGAPVDGYSFDVLVLDADFVNAFALPGGYLILSSALVTKCASPDELAGVLAHEMAHVTRRHGLSRVLRQHVLSFISRFMGLSDNMAGGLLTTLLESSFSREQESEADRLGLERLAGAGINPMAMADFFERLEKRGSGSMPLLRYLSSHPPSAERRDAIRKALTASADPAAAQAVDKAAPDNKEATFSPALEAGAWTRLRALLPAGAAEKVKNGPDGQEEKKEEDEQVKNGQDEDHS